MQSLSSVLVSIFTGDLYIDALIIGLFYVCPVMSQTVGEGTV